MAQRKRKGNDEAHGGGPQRPRTRPKESAPYHHGDLRAALLRAAEVELAEKGVRGFTLRGCARRAGVSHAAPAHHFADVADLLAEMAAIGFERLTGSIRAERAAAPPDPRSQFVASGKGYIAFALANPQHFSLMFGGAVGARTTRLAEAARAAFQELVDDIAALTGMAEPLNDPQGRLDVLFAWSLVHGYAKLAIEQPSGRLAPRDAAARDADIAGVVERAASAIEARLKLI